MLVVTRKVNEKIVVKLPDGNRIEVVIRKIQGNQARVGIEAPEDISILREELESEWKVSSTDFTGI